MKLYSNNVDYYPSLDRYYFDEDFNLRDFSISYELDDHGLGSVQFEPLKRVAYVYYYGDFEQLDPDVVFIGLENTEAGRKLLQAAEENSLGKVDRAAVDWVNDYWKDRA